jgi:glutamine amidotransferase-like uncharacterized protein
MTHVNRESVSTRGVSMMYTMTAQQRAVDRPLALVYRGPAGCPGCSEAVAELLHNSRWNFDVQYVGPDEQLKLSSAILQAAILYAQPGGSGELSQAYQQLKKHAYAIRNYVASGGRYLGICMGGYLAGRTPGFQLLPGDTDQFIASRGASVRTEADSIVNVYWRERPRIMYFQDGPCFLLDDGATGVITLATYTNGQIAALVAPYRKGRVGVSGPHPEATAEWYDSSHLVIPEGVNADLGHDLVDTLMQ